jgi:hypothetical protein
MPLSVLSVVRVMAPPSWWFLGLFSVLLFLRPVLCSVPGLTASQTDETLAVQH